MALYLKGLVFNFLKLNYMIVPKNEACNQNEKIEKTRRILIAGEKKLYKSHFSELTYG